MKTMQIKHAATGRVGEVLGTGITKAPDGGTPQRIYNPYSQAISPGTFVLATEGELPDGSTGLIVCAVLD